MRMDDLSFVIVVIMLIGGGGGYYGYGLYGGIGIGGALGLSIVILATLWFVGAIGRRSGK